MFDSTPAECNGQFHLGMINGSADYIILADMDDIILHLFTVHLLY